LLIIFFVIDFSYIKEVSETKRKCALHANRSGKKAYKGTLLCRVSVPNRHCAKRQLLGFEQKQFLVRPAVITTMMEKEQVIFE